MYQPSVKSIDTRCAPASKQPRMSFSHCITVSSAPTHCPRYRYAYLVHKVFNELPLRITFHGAIQRIKQVHHTRRNDGLFHTAMLGKRLGFLQVLPCIGLVPGAISLTRGGGYLAVCILERPLHKARKLAVMTVIEDSLAYHQRTPCLCNGSHTYEILPISCKTIGQPSASEGAILRTLAPSFWLSQATYSVMG